MSIFNIVHTAHKERASTQWILDRIEGITVLDIGGVGANLKVQDLTRRLLKKNRVVMEVDLVEPIWKHPSLQVIIGDVLDLHPFFDDTFDSVLAIHVVQHVGRNWRNLNTVHDLEGDCKLADKIYKWLKPNGTLFIEVPMSCQVQEVEWSDGTTWKVYTMAEILRVFSRFCFVDCMIYDGAKDSASKVSGAKAAVVMLRKVV